MTFGEKLKPKNLLEMGKDYFDAYKSELGKIKKLGLEEYQAKDLLSLVDDVPITQSAYRNVFSGKPSLYDSMKIDYKMFPNLKPYQFEVSEDGN